MAEPNLASVQSDIESTKEKLAELLTVEKYFLSKIGVANIVEHTNGDTLSVATKVSEPRMTQAEGAQKVLKDSGKPMETIAIVEEMFNKGYCDPTVSKKTLQQNIFSIMSRKREIFKRVGRGIWALNHGSDTTHQGKKSKSRPGSVVTLVKDAISAMPPDATFTAPSLFEIIRAKGISVKERTVKDLVWNLAKEGFLEVVVKGKGRRPNLLKKKQ